MNEESGAMEEPLASVRIKKVGLLSVANTVALINAFIGLIFGLILTLVAVFGGNLFETPGGELLGIIFGFAAIIILPIIMGIIGWINGLIGALFYNLASKISKGIKLYS